MSVLRNVSVEIVEPDSDKKEPVSLDKTEVIIVESEDGFMEMIRWLLGGQIPDDATGRITLEVQMGLSFDRHGEPSAVIVQGKDRTYALPPMSALLGWMTVSLVASSFEKEVEGAAEALSAFGGMLGELLDDMRKHLERTTRH